MYFIGIELGYGFKHKVSGSSGPSCTEGLQDGCHKQCSAKA